jgi:hypothetical protein
MVTPRRQATPAAVRAAVYARLEEIRFRTGVVILAGLLAVIGGVIALAVVPGPGGARRPAPRPLAQSAPLTLAPVPPARAPARRARKARTIRVTAAGQDHPAAAGPPGPAARPAVTRAPGPARTGHGGSPGGWPWPGGHGWPGPHGGHGWPGPHGWAGRHGPAGGRHLARRP